jgi:hypothetical protein
MGIFIVHIQYINVFLGKWFEFYNMLTNWSKTLKILFFYNDDPCQCYIVT